MTHSILLEDFSDAAVTSRPGASQDPGTKDQADALRASFDDGYKCGWQDGADAKEDRDAELRESLSAALQELNFTYFEARQHVMMSVRPVLQAMVDAVLPQLLTESLGGRVVELLAELAEKVEPEITVVCAPQVEPMLRQLVADAIKFPVRIDTEETLTPTQAILHLNDGQTHINLDETLSAIRTSVEDFFNPAITKEAKHA